MREQASRSRAWYLLATLAVFVFAFGPSLVSRDLWPPDEVRYTEVAREMTATRSWILPSINGAVYAEKPPLYFWLVALAHALTGSWTIAARLVSALAIAGMAVATALLGRDLHGPRTGLAAGAMVASCVLVLDHGQRAAIDPLLSCLVTFATWGFARTVLLETPVERARGAAIAIAAVGAGTLVKGPVAIALPVIAAIALTCARHGTVRRFPLGTTGLATLSAAVLGLGWVYLASRSAGSEGGWFMRRMSVDQTLGRMKNSFAHQQPVWYFLALLPTGFLPWIALAPGAVAAAWRARRVDPLRLGVVGWAVATFALFSAISGKRPGYVLPAFAALALIVARRTSDLAIASDSSAVDPSDEKLAPELAEHGLDSLGLLVLRVGLTGTGVALAGLGIAIASSRDVVLFLARFAHLRREGAAEELAAAVPSWGGAAIAVTGVAILALGVALVLARGASAWRRAPLVGAACVALGSCGFHLAIVPALDAQRSFRPVGDALVRTGAPPEKLVLFGDDFDGAINFFTGSLKHEVAWDAAGLRAIADRPGATWVLVREAAWNELEPALRARFAIRASVPVGRHVHHVLSEIEESTR